MKENVIMGHLIPAGTGSRKFKDLRIWIEEESDSVTEESDSVTEELVKEAETE